MGLKLPTAPSDTHDIVSRALKRAHSFRCFDFSDTSGGAASVNPVAPHQVYSIGLQSLAEGGGLQSAKVVGWRTIIMQGRKAVAAVEFSGGGQSKPSNFKSINQGPHVQSTKSAIEKAEALVEVKNADYEVRLLQITGIYLLSLWLHGADKEMFIPLPPAPRNFEPYKMYLESEFFQVAVSAAKRRMEFDDRPKGSSPGAGAPA